MKFYREIEEGGLHKLGVLKEVTGRGFLYYWIIVIPYWIKSGRWKCCVIRLFRHDIEGRVIECSYGEVDMRKE